MEYSLVDNPIPSLVFDPMYRFVAVHLATYHGAIYICAVSLACALYVAALSVALAVTCRAARWIIAAVFVMSLAGCASQPPPAPIIKMVAAPAKKEIVIPPDPFDGLSPDVRAAIESKQTPTLHDGIAVLFPYSANNQWTIYCQPLRATEIRLNAEESTDKDNVVIGDSVRWTMKIGTQAVMVEPLGTSADPNMTTNLIIHTDKRSYHLMLRLRSKFMAAVQWYYPETVRRLQAARQLAQREAAQAADPPRDNNNTNTQEASQ